MGLFSIQAAITFVAGLVSFDGLIAVVTFALTHVVFAGLTARDPHVWTYVRLAFADVLERIGLSSYVYRPTGRRATLRDKDHNAFWLA